MFIATARRALPIRGCVPKQWLEDYFPPKMVPLLGDMLIFGEVHESIFHPVVIESVTFLSLIWRSRTAIERV